MPEEEEKKEVSQEAEVNTEAVKNAEAEFALCLEEMTNVRKGNGITWDEKEALFFGGYFKTGKDGERERHMDSTGELTTLAIDRSCRVMGQLPTGQFENESGDTGKNLAMNLIFEYHVIPNATTGGALLQKLRMVDLYSDLYSIPVMVEWIATDRYTGPDFVIIDPRRFYPQVGKTAIEDMDYCFVETYVSKGWLEKRDKKYFKNVDEIVKKAQDTGPSNGDVNFALRKSKQSGIKIRHRFSSNGDWLAYNPETKLVLVEEKAYYPGIPIRMKHQYPRIGSLWSYTNFDRGFATQKQIDLLGAKEIRAVEMMIDPPAIMDPTEVILSSFKRKAGAKWFVKDGKTDAIKMATIAPQALAAFAETYAIKKANLLSMGSSTDTSITASTDPGFGKSPEALKQQGMRQGARDSWDMYMMQQLIEGIFSLAAAMIDQKGLGAYSFDMMEEAIERIKEEYPEEDIKRFFNGNKFEASKDDITGKYRYRMEPKSTLIEQDGVSEAVLKMVEIYQANNGIKEDLAQSGKRFDAGEAFKIVVREKGSKYANRLIKSAKTDPESVPGIGSETGTVVPPTVEQSVPPEVMTAEAAGQPVMTGQPA